MPDSPDHKDIWHELNQARLDIAELRGMVKMHFEDRQHHIPPLQASCGYAENNHLCTGGSSYRHAGCDL